MGVSAVSKSQLVNVIVAVLRFLLIKSIIVLNNKETGAALAASHHPRRRTIPHTTHHFLLLSTQNTGVVRGSISILSISSTAWCLSNSLVHCSNSLFLLVVSYSYSAQSLLKNVIFLLYFHVSTSVIFSENHKKIIYSI